MGRRAQPVAAGNGSRTSSLSFPSVALASKDKPARRMVSGGTEYCARPRRRETANVGYFRFAGKGRALSSEGLYAKAQCGSVTAVTMARKNYRPRLGCFASWAGAALSPQRRISFDDKSVNSVNKEATSKGF